MLEAVDEEDFSDINSAKKYFESINWNECVSKEIDFCEGKEEIELRAGEIVEVDFVWDYSDYESDSDSDS